MTRIGKVIVLLLLTFILPATMVHADDIVTIATKNKNLSTFVTALKAADLVDTLKGSGQFTVLAPTNAAFDKLPKGTLTSLLKPENKEKLVALLGYHVISGGKYLAADVNQITVGTESPATLNGARWVLTSINPLTINNSKVTTADIIADNGVLHIVDTVLLPPAAPAATATPAAATPPTTAATLGDIVEVASGNPNFSTLVKALKAADLVATLKGSGPFTVLAPNNAAFAKLPKDVLAGLLKPANKAKLAAILTYHVIAGKYTAADASGISVGTQVPTVNGAQLTLTSADPVTINNAKVVMTDIMASNGVIHVLDTVLLPPSADTKEVSPTPATNQAATSTDGATQDLAGLVAAPEYSTFLSAIDSAGLSDALKRHGPLTVFAPTNAAFEKLPKGVLKNLLLPENRQMLQDVITYHFVIGKQTSSDLSGLPSGAKVKTLNRNATLSVASGSTIKVNTASVTKPDQMATNGVLHTIDAVLLPPAN